MAERGASEREAGIIAAYLAGEKVSAIEKGFGLSRSAVYHVLRRSGVVPSRGRRQMDAESADLALAGLHQLIEHQDKVIMERDLTIARMSKELTKLQRLVKRLDGDGPATRRVASKSA